MPHMAQDLATVKRRRFLVGMALAWVPLTFFVFGLANAFRGISESKATGLGAVAGGFTAYFFLFGFMTAVTFVVLSIVLLVRGVTRQAPARSLISVVTIFFCAVWLFGVGIAVYLRFRYF